MVCPPKDVVCICFLIGLILFLIPNVTAFDSWINPDETIFEGGDSFTIKIPSSKTKIDYDNVMLASTKDGIVTLTMGKTISTKNYKYKLIERALADNFEKTGYVYKYHVTIEKFQAKLDASRSANKRELKLFDTVEITAVLSNSGTQPAVDIVYEDTLPQYMIRQGPVRTNFKDRVHVYKGPSYPNQVVWRGTLGPGQDVELYYTMYLHMLPPTDKIVISPPRLEFGTPLIRLNITPLKLELIPPLKIAITAPTKFNLSRTTHFTLSLTNLFSGMSLTIDHLYVYTPESLEVQPPHQFTVEDDAFYWEGTVKQRATKNFEFSAVGTQVSEGTITVVAEAHYFDQKITLTEEKDIEVSAPPLKPSRVLKRKKGKKHHRVT